MKEDIYTWISESGFESKVKNRGLLIRRWAPQVLEIGVRVRMEVVVHLGEEEKHGVQGSLCQGFLLCNRRCLPNLMEAVSLPPTGLAPDKGLGPESSQAASKYPTFRDTLLRRSKAMLIPSEFDIDTDKQAMVESSVIDGDLIKRMVCFPAKLQKSWREEYHGAIIIKKWCPKFIPEEATMSTLITWICIEGLPLEYYHDDALFPIASQIGSPIRVDRQTALVSRGKFARICMEIDLDAPLLPEVGVDGEWFKVVYEGIPTICPFCWHVGHTTADCHLKACTEVMETDLNKELVVVDNATCSAGVHEEERGQWMIPKRPTAKKRTNRRTRNQQRASRQNQFESLVVEGGLNSEEVITEIADMETSKAPKQLAALEARIRAVNHPTNNVDPSLNLQEVIPLDKEGVGMDMTAINLEPAANTPCMTSLDIPLGRPHPCLDANRDASKVDNLSDVIAIGIGSKDDKVISEVVAYKEPSKVQSMGKSERASKPQNITHSANTPVPPLLASTGAPAPGVSSTKSATKSRHNAGSPEANRLQHRSRSPNFRRSGLPWLESERNSRGNNRSRR
ncbi:hypothetical protein LINGRAHAP2_LOCUS31383 [Linum grandiflorum]